MGTWCGPDDPGNSHEPRSWGELLRAWFGNPKAEAGDGTVHTVEAYFGDPANGQVIITSKPAPDAEAEPDHQAEAG